MNTLVSPGASLRPAITLGDDMRVPGGTPIGRTSGATAKMFNNAYVIGLIGHEIG